MSTDLPENPKWYTIRDAAKYLQIGEPTIYRWMRDGKITFRKIGDSTRFLQEDLDAVVVVHPSSAGTTKKPLCPACASQNLIDGKSQSTGALYFTPANTKFWTLKTSTILLHSQMCAQCGYVLFRGNPKHLNEILNGNEFEEEGEE